MSVQKLEEIGEFKLTFRDEFLLEYYRLMSKFAQFKKNFLKKSTVSQGTKTLQTRGFV